MIRLTQVSKTYLNGGMSTPVLRDLSFAIVEGECVAIMGASGSGKTTLMNILGCLDRPTAGTYELDGEDVLQLDDRRLSRLRNRKIGFVFQLFHLLPRLTVRANVLLPFVYADEAPLGAEEHAEEMISLVGLADRISYLPGQLSGGQQQRVAIARALVNNPRVILADEPTGNLDSDSGAGILALFRELNARGRTIVIVTHAEATAAIATRRIELRDGRVIRDTGEPA